MIQFWNIIENVDFEAVLGHFDPFLTKNADLAENGIFPEKNFLVIFKPL